MGEFCVSVNLGGKEGWFQGRAKQAVSPIDTGNRNRSVESLYIFCFVFIIEYTSDQVIVCFPLYTIAVSYKLTLN